ncbi:MAG: FmdB family transcriptional regulator [Nitriliruptorales bacterium]|nr:FmdB family transcriptional regulator [Nitriliruptorales bacterium]
MPTYEYACRDCGQHLEVVQSFRDASLTTCPACQGSLRKVYGAAGIIFKGSGYYVNDSRKTAAESTSASSNGDSASKPAKEESSSDTAASSEAKSA